MIAIIPFCAKNADDFLLHHKAYDIIQSMFVKFDNLSCIDDVKILADKHFIKLFSSLGLNNSIVSKISFPESFNTVLPENITKNTFLLDGLDNDKNIIIISPRNPLISKHIIKTAVKKFKKIKTGLLISVVESSDHPCQLFSLKASENGDAYINKSKKLFAQSRFTENQNLWVAGDNNHLAINQITKKEIRGRQDFPPVYEPDGSFLLSNINTIKQAVQSSIIQNLHGFIIEPYLSVNISNNFDYLKYLANKKKTEMVTVHEQEM